MHMDELLHALRGLRARPRQSLLIVSILALGLASTLFLFGTVRGFLLSPHVTGSSLPLVGIGYLDKDGGGRLRSLPARDWALLQPQLQGLAGVAADNGPMTVNLGTAMGAVRYQGVQIDASAFALLDAPLLLGRLPTAEDAAAGAAAFVLLSERVWREDYGASATVLDQPLFANGAPVRVIGVLSERFRYPDAPHLWMSRPASAAGDVHVVARLGEGGNLAALRQQLDALSLQLAHDLEDVQKGRMLGVAPLQHRFVPAQVRQVLWMMFVTGVLVLLLACANVAHLQYARGLERQHALAVQAAIGASRLRLLRQLLLESLLLCAAAVPLAFGLAHVASQALTMDLMAQQAVPAHLLQGDYDHVDAFYLVVAGLAATLLSGLLPALRASAIPPQAALRGGESASASGRRGSRLLVIGQVAMAVVLLAGTGRYLAELNAMLRFDLGVQAPPEQILTARLGLMPQHYPDAASMRRFVDAAGERLAAIPGVRAISFGSVLPGNQFSGESTVIAEGTAWPATPSIRTDYGVVDLGFADTYAPRVLEGRLFDARDTAGAHPVAVIDQALAQRLWPGGSALGQRIKLDPDDVDAPWMEVVGVIAPLRLRELSDRSSTALLRPLAQSPARFLTLSLRAQGDVLALLPHVTAALRELDPHSPLYWARTHRQAIDAGQAAVVLAAKIFTGVGALALLLAAAGLHGVLSLGVAQRRREIGIRRAVGASHGSVLHVVSARLLWQLGCGLGIGVLLALPWMQLLSRGLQHSAPTGAMTVLGPVLMVIALSAALACFVPLRRALRLDPIHVLKNE